MKVIDDWLLFLMKGGCEKRSSSYSESYFDGETVMISGSQGEVIAFPAKLAWDEETRASVLEMFVIGEWEVDWMLFRNRIPELYNSATERGRKDV
jgi:hypothetical protein